jgi:hypothetical protein
MGPACTDLFFVLFKRNKIIGEDGPSRTGGSPALRFPLAVLLR